MRISNLIINEGFFQERNLQEFSTLNNLCLEGNSGIVCFLRKNEFFKKQKQNYGFPHPVRRSFLVANHADFPIEFFFSKFQQKKHEMLKNDEKISNTPRICTPNISAHIHFLAVQKPFSFLGQRTKKNQWLPTHREMSLICDSLKFPN